MKLGAGERERAEAFGVEYAEGYLSRSRHRSHLAQTEKGKHSAQVTQQNTQANSQNLSVTELKELQTTEDSLEADKHTVCKERQWLVLVS